MDSQSKPEVILCDKTRRDNPDTWLIKLPKSHRLPTITTDAEYVSRIKAEYNIE